MSDVVVIPRRENLTGAVIATLTSRIETGAYAPGDKLPSENELCRELGVSRTVVREAVASLRLGGRLYSRQGSGVFVSGREARKLEFEIKATDDVRSALQILELRLGIEIEAVTLAAQRRNPGDIAALTAAFDGLLAQGANDASAEAKADLAFHFAVAKATGNPHFPQLMEALEPHIASDLLMKHGRTSASGHRSYLARIVKEHGAILSAITQGDAKAARAALRRHLEESMTRYRRLLDNAPASDPGGRSDAGVRELASL